MRQITVALFILSLGVAGYAQELEQESDSATEISRDPAAQRPGRKKRPRIKAPPPATEKQIDAEARAGETAAAPALKYSNDGGVHPVNSNFYHPAKTDLAIASTLGYSMRSFNTKATNSPNFGQNETTESEQSQFRFENEISYGISRSLSVGFGFDYKTITTSDVRYSSTSNINVPLDPDVKNSGISDPSLSAVYRFLAEDASDLFIDVGLRFVIGVQDGKRGASYDSNLDNIDDKASDGNVGQGGTSALLAARVGKMFTESLGAAVSLGLSNSFSSETTSIKGGTNREDVVFNRDSVTSFVLGVTGEFRVTPEFTINPRIVLALNGEESSNYMQSFQRRRIDIEGATSINLGLGGSFALTRNLALTGAYDYTINGSRTGKLFINEIEQQQVVSTDQDGTHGFSVGVRFIF